MWTSSLALSLPALTPLPWWSCVFPSEPAPKSHTDGSEGTTAREEEREREEGRQTERSNRGLLSVRVNPSKPPSLPPPSHRPTHTTQNSDWQSQIDCWLLISICRSMAPFTLELDRQHPLTLPSPPPPSPCVVGAGVVSGSEASTLTLHPTGRRETAAPVRRHCSSLFVFQGQTIKRC